MRIDTANVYYDHPYHAQLDHALCIDFVCEADGGRERVAIEISRESALELIEKIMAALASGDAAHAKAAACPLVGSQAEVASLLQAVPLRRNLLKRELAASRHRPCDLIAVRNS